jgi:MYXO-CTERM domain-containing protein
MTRLFVTLRIAAITLALMFGAVSVSNTVAAQDASAASQTISEATDTNDDEGFDDWGLLGLLGLAGLAGLLKRPTHEVQTVERRDYTGTNRP